MVWIPYNTDPFTNKTFGPKTSVELVNYTDFKKQCFGLIIVCDIEGFIRVSRQFFGDHDCG